MEPCHVTEGASINRLIAILALLAGVGLVAVAIYQVYARPYDAIIANAQREKALVIYSTLHDDAELNELLDAFHRHYPFIALLDTESDSTPTFQRFRHELATGQPSADFLWGPAMDLQEKLINDGYAQPYETSEQAHLPSWAHWKDLGYGVTLEPIAFVYNSKYISPSEMPHTHIGLREMLRHNASRFEGHVALYNPEHSEVGMLLSSQDVSATRDSWDLFETFGKVKAISYGTSGAMLDHIIKGDQWIGYDAIASYALEMHKKYPELMVVYPSDYVLVMSRVAFISAYARHPNAAKLFLDFLLSRDAQAIIKKHGMGSVRDDVGVPVEQLQLNAGRTQAIRIGPGLLVDLDSLVRAQFLRRWPSLPFMTGKQTGQEYFTRS